MSHLLRLIRQGWSPSVALLDRPTSTLIQARVPDPSLECLFEEALWAWYSSWSTPLGSKRAKAGSSGFIEPLLNTLQKLRDQFHVASADF